MLYASRLRVYDCFMVYTFDGVGLVSVLRLIVIV